MAANKRQVYFTNDEEELRVYEMREMALMDERARILYATNEGLTQGRKEGREEVLDMLSQGLTLEEIKLRLTQATNK